jgi:glycosyltransferase involved in cell wall biosynthesis
MMSVMPIPKKTILIDARTIEYSGIGRYLKNLLDNFDKHGLFDFELLVNEKQNDLNGFTQHTTNILPYSLAEQTKLAGVIEALSPELVHFAHFSRPWRRLTVPTITTIHDLTLLDYPAKEGFSLSSKIKQKSLKLGLKNILKNDAAIITPSNFVRRQVTALRPSAAAKITTTYLGFNKSPLSASEKPTQKPPKKFLLYVGNAYAHKNLGILIAALRRDKDLHVIAVGDPKTGYDTYSHSRLHKLGRLSDGALAYLYEHACALVFPSKSEGFGLPGLEAMAHGCPVISSNASCLPEIYARAALYFDPNSVDDLLDQLTLLPDKRTELIKRGRARVDQFSWKTTAKQTLAIYTEALERG